jgi:hypothetical protein
VLSMGRCSTPRVTQGLITYLWYLSYTCYLGKYAHAQRMTAGVSVAGGAVGSPFAEVQR